MPPTDGSREQREDGLMLETHKATTAFFDRLLLVNAGTLSLIITVGSTTLLAIQHPLSIDAGLWHQILVGCSLLHNYLKLSGLSTSLLYLLYRKRAAGIYAFVIAWFCAALGIVACLLTLYGYYMLVKVLGSLPIPTH